MNYVGYKYFDDARTRRSADVLKMETGEKLEQFKKRCASLGFDCVDKRNVIDRYKLMSDDLIKGDMNARRFNFSILLQNLAGDFNKASVIRNNNAFCGKEVILFGEKDYDRRGTTGMHLYENFKHVRCMKDLDETLKGYDCIIGIDNIDGAKPIQTYDWNFEKKTLLIFGEEGIGICPEILDLCNDILYIPQFGAVRSINVSSASAIIMHEYTRNFWNQI
jgi:tRNA G18 (ribose-2'-O)-methylase SpoU